MTRRRAPGGRDGQSQRTAAVLLHQYAGYCPTPAPAVNDRDDLDDRDGPPGGQRARRRRSGGVRAPRQGERAAGCGWSPVDATARLPVFRATSADAAGFFPLLAENGTPAAGARLGYDVRSGATFYCHPSEWVLRKITTNPNVAIFGKPGTGKSTTVLKLILELSNYHVRTLISGDVKGEYSPTLRAMGITPIALGRGSAARVNALDLGPLARRWDSWPVARQVEEITGLLARWTRLLTALAGAQGYRATVTDEMMLATVLRRLIGVGDGYSSLRPVTIPQVVALMADPDDALWTEARFPSRRAFLDHTRLITDALSKLVAGPLAGLFDEPTNIELDWDAPVQSMDLSLLRSRGDEALAVALTCLGSWSSMITDLQDDGDVRIVVRDEVWRQMRLGLSAVQAVDEDLRLSRADRKMQVLVMHKPSDLLSVGAAGSQEVAIAEGLLALCSTRVLLGQAERVGGQLAEEIGLSDREQDAVTGWANGGLGRALWKLEQKPGMKIQTILTPTEQALFDTNAGLRAPASSQAAGPGGPRLRAVSSPQTADHAPGTSSPQRRTGPGSREEMI